MNYARCHRLAHFNSKVTFNSAIILGVSRLCALLYLKCRYLAGELSFDSKGSWTVAFIMTTVRHFDILLYIIILVKVHMVFCDHRHRFIGKGFWVPRILLQASLSVEHDDRNHMI